VWVWSWRISGGLVWDGEIVELDALYSNASLSSTQISSERVSWMVGLK